jgi:hypothetical protein
MTLRRFSLLTTPTARTSAGLAVLTLLGVGIATANTEAVVAGRFTAALEAAPKQTVADLKPDQPLVSGSEAYWLDKRRHDNGGAALEQAAWSPTPIAAGFSLGSRITISNGKDKADRVLEVIAITEVESIPGALNKVEPSNVAHKVAITCRDLSSPDGRLVTFEAPAELAPASRPLI